MKTNEELENMFHKYVKAAEDRMDDIHEQQIDHHLILRDFTHLFEKIDKRFDEINTSKASDTYDAKIEQLENKFKDFEDKFNTSTYNNFKNARDTKSEHDHEKCMNDIAILKTKLLNYEIKFQKYESKLDQLSAILKTKLLNYEIQFQKYESKLDQLSATLEKHMNKSEDNVTLVKSLVSSELSMKENAVEQMIQMLQNNIWKQEALIEDLTMRFEFEKARNAQSQHHNSTENLSEEVTQLKNTLKKLEKEIRCLKNEQGKSTVTVPQMTVPQMTVPSVYNNDIFGPRRNEQSVFDSTPSLYNIPALSFGTPKVASQSNGGPWVCRNCGRVCGARIGLYSHEKSCFRKSGRPFDG